MVRWMSSPASPGRVLDLAFPAVCPGLPARGAADLRALPARARRATGAGRRASRSACRRRCRRRCSSSSGARPSAASCVGRSIELKYGGETRLARPARRGRRAALAAGRGRRQPARAGSGPRGAATSTRLRPGGADRRGRGRVPSGCRWRPCSARERSTIAQFDLDRRRRATNVAGAFGLAPGAAGVGDARRPATARGRSPAGGSSSSTTSSRPARRWPRAPSHCWPRERSASPR